MVPHRSLAPLLLSIGVAVIAFAWLNHVNPLEFPNNDDSIRDQLMASDCVDLGHCYLIGPATSLSGFHQGAVWLDLLVSPGQRIATPEQRLTPRLGQVVGAREAGGHGGLLIAKTT